MMPMEEAGAAQDSVDKIEAAGNNVEPIIEEVQQIPAQSILEQKVQSIESYQFHRIPQPSEIVNGEEARIKAQQAENE